MKGKFIAFDLLRANSNYTSVCEIAIVVFIDGKVVDRKHWKIRPEPFEENPFCLMEFDVYLGEYTNAPVFAEIWEELKPYLEEAPLLIFKNPKARISPIYYIAEFSGIQYSFNQGICGENMAQEAYPFESYVDLNFLAYKHGVTVKGETLLSYVETAGKLTLRMAQELNIATVDQALADFGIKYTQAKRKTRYETPSFTKGPKKNIPLPELDPEHVFYGKTVCFTGNFKGITRKEGIELVNCIGGKGVDEFNEKIDFLVVGDQAGSREKSQKMIKADKMLAKGKAVSVVDQYYFFELFI